MLATVPAVAGTLYRCETPGGDRSYVSKRVPGAKCTVVSSYASRQSRAPVKSAVGSATAVSQVAGSPTAVTTGTPVSTPANAAVGGRAGDAASPEVAQVAQRLEAPRPATPNAPRVVRGQVYSYIKDGVRHYSSAPPRGVAKASAVRTIKYSYIETCFACSARPGVNFGSVRLNTNAYRDEIRAAASKFGVDEAIVRAIIHAESAYNPNALSRVGAQGLMQLMPATARRFGVSNAFNANQNIHGGVEYLAWLLKRFNGNLTLAAAGYNAGEGAVDKYKGVPPYSETQRYVQRVALLADRYRGAVAQ